MTENYNPALAFQSLGAEDIAGILAGAKDERKAREESKSGSGGGYIPIGYPQEGVSKIRIFLDPERKLYRPVKTFKLPDKKKVMDPRFFTDGKDPQGNAVPKELTEEIWKLQKGLTFKNAGGLTPSYTVLCYIKLIETDKPDDKFWKPGTVYVGAMNGKFEEALLAQISSLSKGVPGELAKALNPLLEGWAFDMTLVKGTQGSCSLTPTIGINYPGIELTPAYKPLREQFVAEGLVMEDQTALVDALKAKRVELELDEAPEGSDAPTPPKKEGEEQEAPKPESKVEEKIPESNEGTGGGAAGDSWNEAGSNSASTSSSAAPAETKQEGEETTYGLSAEQIAAAKAANIPLKQFAEMMGLPT